MRDDDTTGSEALRALHVAGVGSNDKYGFVDFSEVFF